MILPSPPLLGRLRDSPDNHSPAFSPALSVFIRAIRGSILFGCGIAALRSPVQISLSFQREPK